jgi:MinD-like ATPase involved in chromosome partitioning or flagellar assembly
VAGGARRDPPKGAPALERLRFDRLGGPALAICSLCGGAGASTLTHLVAASAAEVSTAPVLACDAGAVTPGLEIYAEAASGHALAELADCVAAGERPRGAPVAVAEHGLRVLAAGPRPGIDGDPEGLRRVLADARDAHGLCVFDCGTLARPAQRAAAEASTHIARVVAATLSGVRRARAALDAHTEGLDSRELVVARQDPAGRRPPMRELTRLADERAAPLVLFPHLPDLAEAALDERIETAQLALEALGTLLSR